MIRFVVGIAREVGRQTQDVWDALRDPYNRATVLVSVSVALLLVAAAYLLVTRYDALLRLVHHGLSCESLSNDKAAVIIVLGTVFALSVPITIGTAVARSEARRRGRSVSPAELIVALLVSASSGALLVGMAFGFC